jgi:uncharacterized damage-inducible protein DinB
MTRTVGEICRQHLDYMKWADEIALKAVAESEPQRIATLQHIFLAERVWLMRVSGDLQVRLGDLEAPVDIGALKDQWAEMHRAWLDFAASVNDWETILTFRASTGQVFSSSLWQIVLHVVNHGSYHRGQVSAMLRAAGHAPSATDLIAYYRLS